MEKAVGPGHPRTHLSLCYSLGVLLSFSGDESGGLFSLPFFTRGWGPDYARRGRSGTMEKVICKITTTDCIGSGGAAAMALWAACSGVKNRISHTFKH